MRHLFSPAGRQALAAVLQRRPLLAFDFDGTLAPIVARPDEARISAAVAHALAQLARRRPVAIVTGRRVADVRPRLGFEPAYVVGNHGAEGLPGAVAAAPAAAADPALDSARQRLAHEAARLAQAGVTVEDKGASIALHYRLAPLPEMARSELEALFATLPPGLRSFGGKRVLNLVPAGAPDKGAAVTRLLAHAGCDCAVFLGDDINDEAVFEVSAPDWLTVRIGRDEPASRARFFLDTPAEVALLLQRMLALLGAPAADP
ncbi:MAG: trehalose-phosphatase [Burkholderiales bacterium]|nr:trehalose-phosphatase [Burkholderiales bacterium]